jgi:hypothetical protein
MTSQKLLTMPECIDLMKRLTSNCGRAGDLTHPFRLLRADPHALMRSIVSNP